MKRLHICVPSSSYKVIVGSETDKPCKIYAMDVVSYVAAAH